MWWQGEFCDSIQKQSREISDVFYGINGKNGKHDQEQVQLIFLHSTNKSTSRIHVQFHPASIQRATFLRDRWCVVLPGGLKGSKAGEAHAITQQWHLREHLTIHGALLYISPFGEITMLHWGSCHFWQHCCPLTTSCLCSSYFMSPQHSGSKSRLERRTIGWRSKTMLNICAG